MPGRTQKLHDLNLPSHGERKLAKPEVPRANIAVSNESPHGTRGCSEKFKDYVSIPYNCFLFSQFNSNTYSFNDMIRYDTYPRQLLLFRTTLSACYS